MKIYDELYRVDIQDWHNWPKALIMVHDYSTNGHDHRKETKRYVPEETFAKLNAETIAAKGWAEAAKAMYEHDAERARKATAYAKDNISRLRDRIHEISADRERVKAENAKLRELVRIMHGELVACEDNRYVCGGHKFDDRVRELGIETDE